MRADTVVYLAYFCIHFISKGAMENFRIKHVYVDWNTANESCRKLEGTLVRIKDLQTVDVSGYMTRNTLKIPSQFWSSVKGLFTPWMIYRGCYPQPSRKTYEVRLSLHTVGNCFSHCKRHFLNELNFIALGDKMCFCLKNEITLQLAESNMCNITCNNSTDDGFCGGDGYITLYEVYKGIYIDDGFCLAYNCKYDYPYVSGYDCDEQHEGACVDILGNFHYQSSITWNGYSMACKAKNQFLTAFIESSFYRFSCENPTWTGIRRYKIYQDDEDRDCYKILRELGVWLYQKVSCDTKLPFVCRLSHQFQRSSIALAPVSLPVVNVTGSSLSSVLTISSQRTKSESAVIGLVAGSITGVVLLIAIVLTFFFVRKKRQSMNQRAPPVENVIYGLSNLDRVENIENRYVRVIANDTNNSEKLRVEDTDNVYVENAEGEYDHLRTPRFKTDTTDAESHYDRTESAYTVATRDVHCDKIYGSHYNCMDSSEQSPYNSKGNDVNKVYGSDYSSLAENTYGSKSSECTSQEKSHYDTTFCE